MKDSSTLGRTFKCSAVAPVAGRDSAENLVSTNVVKPDDFADMGQRDLRWVAINRLKTAFRLLSKLWGSVLCRLTNRHSPAPMCPWSLTLCRCARRGRTRPKSRHWPSKQVDDLACKVGSGSRLTNFLIPEPPLLSELLEPACQRATTTFSNLKPLFTLMNNKNATMSLLKTWAFVILGTAIGVWLGLNFSPI